MVQRLGRRQSLLGIQNKKLVNQVGTLGASAESKCNAKRKSVLYSSKVGYRGALLTHTSTTVRKYDLTERP